ncbi:helix-turn-helix domain-containing protein [Bacillus paralicheniformis]|uniref:helix-turn-helix domain-containing protein n=1 Tax=Bacillus paralicheniformis TaxID=1648923 RepID=UPI0011A573B8|nr:helix-turn-helix domain-containing protein [Bacillus paralicheniformis]
MSKKIVWLSRRDVGERLEEAFLKGYIFEASYRNPFLLATLYYHEGLSTVDIADLLECEQRTVRRYMNYYGLFRFTKRFSLLVAHHGVDEAKRIMQPEFYPLGRHDD